MGDACDIQYEALLRTAPLKTEPDTGRHGNPCVAIHSNFFDPKLIGGLKIMVGDKVIDATVRGKLDAMAAALTH